MAPKRTTRSTPAPETTTTTSVTNAQLKALIDQGVAAALAARDTKRSRNGDDSHNSGIGSRRTKQTACECTYTDFLKCQPLKFKGTEGVVGLTQWFERMETVFNISNCAVENQVKFATCTLHGVALTWWKSHVKIELALLCGRMFPEESDKIEKYVGGLPDMIHGSVVASNPKTMQDAVEIATELMDKKIHTFAERQTETYVVGSGEKKPYGGSKPLCPKCNYHHDGPCAPKCHKCNRVGHLARDCRSTTNANPTNNQRGTRAGQKPTCYECGAQGHFKRECPKLKNNNQGNPVRNGNALARAYAVGNAGTNPNANVVTSTFLLNNHYAIILFDTGADRSFVSTAFSSLIDIILIALDYGVDVELADGRIICGNKTLIVRGDGSSDEYGSRLNIISCTKTQKYLLKGCQVFLAHVTTKKAEDKSKEKRLEDVPIVQDFPDRRLIGHSTDPTSGISNRFDTWCCTCSTGTLSISSVRDKRIVGPAERAFRQGLYKTQFLTLGSIGLGDKQEAPFQLLKQKLCSAPILALPEGSKDFIAYCDTSIKGKIRYHPRKANVVADALSRKERDQPLRVRALVMTIGLDLLKHKLNAPTEANESQITSRTDV
ncbi:putative reverse transcriptase domain-containing protein [Tanacetum coccineum]